MSATAEAPPEEAQQKGLLAWIEKVGNKVPNPTIMFVYLIGIIAVLSAILAWVSLMYASIGAPMYSIGLARARPARSARIVRIKPFCTVPSVTHWLPSAIRSRAFVFTGFGELFFSAQRRRLRSCLPKKLVIGVNSRQDEPFR